MTSYFKEAAPIHSEEEISFFSPFFPFFSVVILGRGGISTKECLAVFGDDIKIAGKGGNGGRRLENNG